MFCVCCKLITQTTQTVCIKIKAAQKPFVASWVSLKFLWEEFASSLGEELLTKKHLVTHFYWNYRGYKLQDLNLFEDHWAWKG